MGVRDLLAFDTSSTSLLDFVAAKISMQLRRSL